MISSPGEGPAHEVVRIGTRGSKLALWQANMIRDQLIQLDENCDIKIIKTQGDKIDNVPFGHGRDNTALKGDRVRCIRDEIAAVAAETEEIARRAVSLIRVEPTIIVARISRNRRSTDSSKPVSAKPNRTIVTGWELRSARSRSRSHSSRNCFSETIP